MQNTTNLNLKKPEYTDFADIQDINDNMDILDDALHDTQNSVATFTTSDTADGSASSWTTVPALTSGETHKSLFAKMSQMFKNIRFLYKLLGTTDISSIGNGTVTGGLSSLNDSFGYTIRSVPPLPSGHSLHAVDIPETAYCPSWTDGPTNTSAAGYTLNLPHMDNKRYKKVFYMPYNSNNLYYTTCNDGVWSAWTKII